ncbi:hypothetical protein [Neobacillus ginsengisoli]|uniref:ABC-type multidrug transport system permease subunit n=1 Tax=Neobacillus ginsengisoli TaxID=904295 RepID=A0ABT9XSW3_9BACI|nr:hypothetical protein [Neobacillus ginsengisoli]MDQ0198651.1 ABC-type multidrug transport system permease subunit [Neobacillus ginsengisoli]
MDQHQGGKEKSGSLKDLWLGIGIAVGIYLLGLLIMFTMPPFILVYILLSPIALIVITIISFKKGKKQLGQGLLIGIGIDILLFAACFGIFFSNLGG